MSHAKTRPTSVSPDAYIAALDDPVRRSEAGQIDRMMRRVSGQAPQMWGPSMIGYGSYHYRYDSGREGDAMRIGFAPRKGEHVLYLLSCDSGAAPHQTALLERLGKHRTGKSCLYVRKLADVDLNVLEELARTSWADMERRYPTSA